MSIVFQTAGILTTVQDLGRHNFQRFGINPNGAMDKTAIRLINILLGNNESESVLEMHFPASKILFEEDSVIALGGANFSPKIETKEVQHWGPIYIRKGNILDFDRKILGNRCYLSVKGGFKINDWLGSKSTNLKAQVGGFDGRKLQKDDQISFTRKLDFVPQKMNFRISRNIIPVYSSLPTVRVSLSAEFEELDEQSKNTFQSQNFTVRHESDRMGIRLKGERLRLKKSRELVSSAVNFGTVQLLPDGQMIILMADHQTTGGYPRIANIISRDLPLVAQLGANDRLNFKIVSIEESENLLLELEKDLNLLKTACRFLC